ncbi:MAG TPA: hypothetical protein VLI04_12215, partial [Nocardioidaceae bacterium]|nr:hypothetical protein [Nocardioidaceae bacterium]
NGVNVIFIEEPVNGPPSAANAALNSAMRTLSEENPDDFGYPDYNTQDKVLYVNLATPRGEELYAGLKIPEGARVVVRKGAHSITELDAITRKAYDVIPEFYEGSIDGKNDRVVMTSPSVSRDLLRRVKEHFGPDLVAVRWQPFGHTN